MRHNRLSTGSSDITCFLSMEDAIDKDIVMQTCKGRHAMMKLAFIQ